MKRLEEEPTLQTWREFLSHVYRNSRPELIVSLIGQIAKAKSQQREIFDITELSTHLEDGDEAAQSREAQQVTQWLTRAVKHEHVGLEQKLIAKDPLEAVFEAAKNQQVIFIGSSAVATNTSTLSFGAMHDALVRDAACDVLVTVHSGTGTSCAETNLGAC